MLLRLTILISSAPLWRRAIGKMKPPGNRDTVAENNTRQPQKSNVD